jgi:SseB protein N-terminal domain
MLPIDPGDGQGGASDGQNRHGSGHAFAPAQPLKDVVPARPLRDIVPAQAMARGGTIIRPGAVAWGGLRDARDSGYSSGESIERILASTMADPGLLPALLAKLAGTRLWVPLPVRRRPFTDGTAVRLPLIGYTETDTDFVPCFTSVQRLTRWADDAEADARSGDDVDEFRFAGGGRQWQRAGDARVVPHVVVPAAGLARRLPAGLGLALNPGGAPGLPLFPESVSYLARLDGPVAAAIAVGHPPAEPLALLNAVRARLRRLRFVRTASRAWLTIPGRGEGLVISVALDDPAGEPAYQAVIGELLAAVASVPLHVPFPVDVAFAGEPANVATEPEPEPACGEPVGGEPVGGEPVGGEPVGGEPVGGEPVGGEPVGGDRGLGGEPTPDVIAEWMSRNTRPFYTRD